MEESSNTSAGKLDEQYMNYSSCLKSGPLRVIAGLQGKGKTNNVLTKEGKD